MRTPIRIIDQDSWRNEYQGDWDRVSNLDRVATISSGGSISSRMDALEEKVNELIAENNRLRKIMETPDWEEAIKVIEEM